MLNAFFEIQQLQKRKKYTHTRRHRTHTLQFSSVRKTAVSLFGSFMILRMAGRFNQYIKTDKTTQDILVVIECVGSALTVLLQGSPSSLFLPSFLINQ